MIELIFKVREPKKFDGCLCQIIDFCLELGCFFPWAPCLADHAGDTLVKCGSSHFDV